MQPTRGQSRSSRALRVSLLDQHRDFGGATTVWEAAAGQFAELLALEQSLADQADQLEHDSSEAALERYGRDLERFEREGGYTFAPRVDAVLHGLGFDPGRRARARRATERRRARTRWSGTPARQPARCAAARRADQPPRSRDDDWLEDYLRESSATILLISHDRAFLAAVVDHVLHFEGDTATPYAGGTRRSSSSARSASRSSGVRATAEEDRERGGLHRAQHRGTEQQAGERTSQAARALAAPQSAARRRRRRWRVRFEVAERGGDQVLHRGACAVSVEDRVLDRGFHGALMRGDRSGLIGPNGAGKSTLSDADRRAPTVERRAAPRRLHHRRVLSAGHGAGPARQDAVRRDQRPRPPWERGMMQGHLGRFGFSGDEVQRRADTLRAASGRASRSR